MIKAQNAKLIFLGPINFPLQVRQLSADHDRKTGVSQLSRSMTGLIDPKNLFIKDEPHCGKKAKALRRRLIWIQWYIDSNIVWMVINVIMPLENLDRHDKWILRDEVLTQVLATVTHGCGSKNRYQNGPGKWKHGPKPA